MERTQIKEKSRRTVPPTKSPSSRSGAPASSNSIRTPNEIVNTKTSRETTQEKIDKIKEHYREKEARARERRGAKAMREKIQRHVKKLSDTLLK